MCGCRSIAPFEIGFHLLKLLRLRQTQDRHMLGQVSDSSTIIMKAVTCKIMTVDRAIVSVVADGLLRSNAMCSCGRILRAKYWV